MKCFAVAVLTLAGAPALADEFMVAALDRCLPTLYQGVLEGRKNGGCARHMFLRCDGRPDPAACQAGVDRAVRKRIADLTSGSGKPSVPATAPDNGFDCRSAFSDDYCDIWDEAGRLDELVINAARQRTPLELAKVAAIADDLALPMRLFDKCLDRATAAGRGKPVALAPEGLLCAEFLSTECRIMADPSACATNVSAALRERITEANPSQPPQYRVLPDQRSHHSREEVALLNLVLRVAETQLTPPVTGVPKADSP